jgi:Rrf2 family transcriptional regulator, iron-sulfur cluster assembly transcription factor
MLSRSAEYALRIMAYMALRTDCTPMRAKDLAEQVNIPIFYLSKILRRMVTADLLKATKGHGGGFLTTKPPEKIRFVDVFSAIEGEVVSASCVFGWDKCSDKTPCVLHHRWKEARRSFETWAKNTTLADVKGDILSASKSFCFNDVPAKPCAKKQHFKVTAP